MSTTDTVLIVLGSWTFVSVTLGIVIGKGIRRAKGTRLSEYPKVERPKLRLVVND